MPDGCGYLAQSRQQQQITFAGIDNQHFAITTEFASKFNLAAGWGYNLGCRLRGNHNSVKLGAKRGFHAKARKQLTFSGIGQLPLGQTEGKGWRCQTLAFGRFGCQPCLLRLGFGLALESQLFGLFLSQFDDELFQGIGLFSEGCRSLAFEGQMTVA